MDFRSRYIDGVALRLRHVDLLPLQISALNFASADLHSSALYGHTYDLKQDTGKLLGTVFDFALSGGPAYRDNLIAE
jgi:hypothetical protein